MVNLKQVRALVLGMPEVVEADHHGRPSFRIGNRILASLPDDEHVNVFCGEDEARASVQEHPQSLELLWWGKRLYGVRVLVESVEPALLAEVLDEAWRRRAPARLTRETPPA